MPEKLGRHSRAPRVLYDAEYVTDSKGRRDPKSDEEEEEEDEGIADIEHEEECTMCGGRDDLIPCSSCVSAFHMDCHDPPLRRPPRANTWRCVQCRTGQRILRAKDTRRGKSTKKRQHVVDLNDDDDEDYKSYPSKTSKRAAKMSKSNSRSSVVGERNFRASARRAKSRDEQSSSSESDSDQKASRSKSRRSRNEEVEGESIDVSHSKVNIPTNSTARGASHDQESEKSTILEIIGRLLKHRSGWPFLQPVDVKEVPDYLSIVKKPMDLQTMKEKCLAGEYSSCQQFINDFSLMIRNADDYNQPNSPVIRCIQPLENCLQGQLEKHFPDCKYISPISEV